MRDWVLGLFGTKETSAYTLPRNSVVRTGVASVFRFVGNYKLTKAVLIAIRDRYEIKPGYRSK